MQVMRPLSPSILTAFHRKKIPPLFSTITSEFSFLPLRFFSFALSKQPFPLLKRQSLA